MTYKKGDTVWREVLDEHLGDFKWSKKLDGPLKVMGQFDGYLMVRKPRAMPFVLAVKDAKEPT